MKPIRGSGSIVARHNADEMELQKYGRGYRFVFLVTLLVPIMYLVFAWSMIADLFALGGNLGSWNFVVRLMVPLFFVGTMSWFGVRCLRESGRTVMPQKLFVAERENERRWMHSLKMKFSHRQKFLFWMWFAALMLLPFFIYEASPSEHVGNVWELGVLYIPFVLGIGYQYCMWQWKEEV